MNVLVVVAHPDDEVLGVGGTIAKHAAQGDHVHVVVVADGKSSRAVSSTDQMTASHLEMERACEIMGCASVERLDLPDNRLDSMDMLDVVQLVEERVARRAPSVVYTHHEGDINIDHGVVSRAVVTATRPLPGAQVQRVFSFQTLSSTEWRFQNRDAFVPNWFVDISEQLATKVRAMAAYESELRSFPHPRSLDAIEHDARAWGARAGVLAAEPLQVVRGSW